MLETYKLAKNNIFIFLATKISKKYIKKMAFYDSKDDLLYFSLVYFVFTSQFTIDNILLFNMNRGYTSETIFEHDNNFQVTYNFLLQEIISFKKYFTKIGITNWEKIAYELAVIYYVFYKKYDLPQLTVFIDYSRNIIGKIVIENLINKTFNMDTIKLVNSPQKASIIITDSLTFNHDSKMFFFVEDVFDSITLNSLALFLLDESLKL